jgi:hypothetical protein
MLKPDGHYKDWADAAIAIEPVMKVIDLITKITQAEHLILVEGKQPSNIYLGQLEKKALIKEEGVAYRQGDENKTQNQRTGHLCGMELHFVEDESYFKMF